MWLFTKAEREQMWLFTKEGYFSIGCGQDSDGLPDPTVKMIRGRCPHQLQKLINNHDILEGKRVVETYETDYTYRILCNEWELEHLLADISMSIDYCNFKHEVLFNNPADWQFIRLLQKIWEMWYVAKGGFVTLTKKKKKKGTPNGNNAKSGKKKNGKQRRKAGTPKKNLRKGKGRNASHRHNA